jgi:predicted GNAT superfamily acetyltransferase
MLEAALLPISPAVEPEVLALNNAHAAELSWLDRDRLTFLLRQAFHARRIGEIDGFLLAFDHGAAYDSPNYLWFRQRYRRFVYIDRVVVAPAARGRGCAGRLYADLLSHARQAGHDIVVCEVNRDPPNPALDAFHAEVGHATIHHGSKTVRYLARAIER